LADNKTADFAEWDFEKLSAELNELTELADFEMSMFGFDEVFKMEEEYNTDFSLPSGERETFVSMAFTLASEQAEVIKNALASVGKNITETFGNENRNGNALYEVVRQWEEQRKLNSK
jgi:hypothetical protein